MRRKSSNVYCANTLHGNLDSRRHARASEPCQGKLTRLYGVQALNDNTN